MHITKKTRKEIADLIIKGYNKGYARDGEDKIIIWEINMTLER